MGKWGTAFDILRDVVYGQSEYLDLYEQTTLHFIYRRTHFFGKEWERIPLRHFLRGVWSKDYGCITPPIRISEKKLLESLKSLEAKTIIQVRRAVTKSNSYRIAKLTEIDTGRILEWYIPRQPLLLQAQIRQLERNIDILDDACRQLLDVLKREFVQVHARTADRDYRTRNVTVTPLSTVGVPAQVGEHKIPITSKKPMKVTPRRSAPLKATSPIDAQSRTAAMPADDSRFVIRPRPGPKPLR